MATYYERHKEEMKAGHKKWASENRELMNAYTRKSRKKPEVKEKSKEWREKNPDKMKKYRKKCDTARYTNPGRILNRYKYNAKKRSIGWELEDEEAKKQLIDACHYCGLCPSNGIDRKDSNVVYKPENCLPCCGTCNRAKHEMPYEVFVSYLERVCKFRNNK
mgnify:CR=1 FL=1